MNRVLNICSYARDVEILNEGNGIPFNTNLINIKVELKVLVASYTLVKDKTLMHI